MMDEEEDRIELECLKCGHRYLAKRLSEANDRCHRDVPVTDSNNNLIDIEECGGKVVPIEELERKAEEEE